MQCCSARKNCLTHDRKAKHCLACRLPATGPHPDLWDLLRSTALGSHVSPHLPKVCNRRSSGASAQVVEESDGAERHGLAARSPFQAGVAEHYAHQWLLQVTFLTPISSRLCPAHLAVANSDAQSSESPSGSLTQSIVSVLYSSEFWASNSQIQRSPDAERGHKQIDESANSSLLWR